MLGPSCGNDLELRAEVTRVAKDCQYAGRLMLLSFIKVCSEERALTDYLVSEVRGDVGDGNLHGSVREVEAFSKDIR